jgi:hypothetical protein
VLNRTWKNYDLMSFKIELRIWSAIICWFETKLVKIIGSSLSWNAGIVGKKLKRGGEEGLENSIECLRFCWVLPVIWRDEIWMLLAEINEFWFVIKKRINSSRRRK